MLSNRESFTTSIRAAEQSFVRTLEAISSPRTARYLWFQLKLLALSKHFAVKSTRVYPWKPSRTGNCQANVSDWVY